MKKEEEKSYVGLFVLLSFILAATNVWAIWNEIVGKRPWKEYQKNYYALELQKLKNEYNDALLAFQHPTIQQKYNAVKEKLDNAWNLFKKPDVQYEYNGILKELHALGTEELSPLKFRSIVTRNKMLEEEYLYGKYKSEETQNRIKELEKSSEEISVKIALVEVRRQKLKERIDEIKSDITKYTEQVGLYGMGIGKVKEKYDMLRSKRPELQVYQVHLAEINEVDRCMSCHVGINRKEGVSIKHPYASPMRREVYIGNHPPEKFGCVLCHEGQGRATTSVEKAHGEVEYWLKPMLRGKVAQSTCIKCHEKSVELEGGEELWKGIKLFEELGCHGCHLTEGFGRDEYRMIGPDLMEISSKVNAEWLVEWLKGPKDFRPTTRMPDFELGADEARAITSYLWQNSKEVEVKEQDEFNEEMVEEGAFIFEGIGCLACHSDEEDAEKMHGPNLTRIGEKVDYEYLVSWLLDPKLHQPKTRMPDFRLDEEDATYLAAYLMSLRSEGYEVSTEETSWLHNKDTARQGERLINRYGCFGCHEIAGMDEKSKIGVELTEIGSKDIHLLDFGLLEKKILNRVGLKRLTENIGETRRAWISTKLSDPRRFDEGRYRRPEDKLRMPDFGLSGEEVEALSILLMGLREEKLPESYMYKMTEEQRYLGEGKRVVEKYNCMGCHQFSIDTLYLEDGTEVKGMVKLEEEDSLYFQLWEDNEMLGRKAGETARLMKKWIKNRIRSKGGDIASIIIDYHVEEEGRVPEEARVFTPPILYGEGKKVQFTWLFKFLNKPITLRPWIETRMPTFNFQHGEVTSIVKYFAIIDNEQYPYEFFKESDEEYIKEKEEEKPGYMASARSLFESKDVNCASCHVRGDITPEGDPSDWAPDLSLASKRLKPNWIVRWLLNPQLIQPGTKMPKFFRKDVFQDLFSGTPTEQAEAVKDLLMNFPQDMLISEEPDKSVKNISRDSTEKTKES